MFKSAFSANNNYIQPTIKNEVDCDASYLSLEFFKNSLSSVEVRRELFEKGTQSAIKFIESLQNWIITKLNHYKTVFKNLVNVSLEGFASYSIIWPSFNSLIVG